MEFFRKAGLACKQHYEKVVLMLALVVLAGAVFYLPLLSLPFVLVAWLSLAAAPFLGIVARAAPQLVPPHGPAWLPGVADLYLRSLGAIFFSPTHTPASPGIALAARPKSPRAATRADSTPRQNRSTSRPCCLRSKMG